MNIFVPKTSQEIDYIINEYFKQYFSVPQFLIFWGKPQKMVKIYDYICHQINVKPSECYLITHDTIFFDIINTLINNICFNNYIITDLNIRTYKNPYNSCNLIKNNYAKIFTTSSTSHYSHCAFLISKKNLKNIIYKYSGVRYRISYF